MKEEKGKGEELHKIVLFTDGSIMRSYGNVTDVEAEAKEKHPNKTIAVII